MPTQRTKGNAVKIPATLPIRDIRNANPVWLRDQLGPVDQLAKSIRAHGLNIPVLLRSDWVMLDGARRLAAVDKLGWTEIPVVIANSWDQVIKYFTEVLELENSSTDMRRAPMRWSELDELWSVLLKPIHEERRRTRIGAQRKVNDALRAQGRFQQKTRAYTEYTQDLADMFGYSVVAVKSLRDSFARLRGLNDTHPEFVADLRTLWSKVELEGIDRIYSIKHGIRLVREGRATPDQALRIMAKALGSGVQLPRTQRKSRLSLPDMAAPEVQPRALRNFVTTLEQLSVQSMHFLNFREDTESAQEAASTIRLAVSRINQMRRRLENSVGLTPVTGEGTE